MKKVFALFGLLVISFCVLGLSGIKGEHHPSEYYFRENSGQLGEYYWAFCGNGTEEYQQRRFESHFVSLRTRGVLPAIPEEELESVSGYYDSEGSLCLLTIDWGSVTAYIYPPETEFWNSYYEMAEECTRTEVKGVTIYGDGTADSDTKALCLELGNGTNCFVVGTNYADAADMVLLAEHFANYGLDLETFAMGNGDHYEYVALSDARTMAFAEGCIPEELEIYDGGLELKNWAPNRAIFHYSLGVGKDVTWVVLPGYHDLYEGPDMGDISELSLGVMAEYFGEKYSEAGFWCNGKYIYIMVVNNTLADDLWELIRALK